MQSSRKQPSRRLEKRENSRRWLLIPALCAAVILAVVLIVELNKQPQVLPDNSNTTPVSHDQPTTPDPEPEPDPEPIPELLTLVNPWNQVPEDWTVDLVTLPNGLEIDKRCYDALMDMIDGCYDAGLTPVICSAYRTQDFQQTLHDNKVSEWMEQGYSREEAREKAGHQVAVPGTSEHQLGLAVDIVDVNYQLLAPTRRTPPCRSGCWKTAGAMASSCAILRARRMSLESCMSRGIIGMSVRSTPRTSTKRVSAWSSIWSNGESETLAHAARVEKTMDKHL